MPAQLRTLFVFDPESRMTAAVRIESGGGLSIELESLISDHRTRLAIAASTPAIELFGRVTASMDQLSAIAGEPES
jgi:hypothetical protein